MCVCVCGGGGGGGDAYHNNRDTKIKVGMIGHACFEDTRVLGGPVTCSVGKI